MKVLKGKNSDYGRYAQELLNCVAAANDNWNTFYSHSPTLPVSVGTHEPTDTRTLISDGKEQKIPLTKRASERAREKKVIHFNGLIKSLQ